MSDLKKRFTSLYMNEDGMIFPWVIFLTLLMLLATMTSTQLYRNQLFLTDAQKASILKQSVVETTREVLEEELRLLPGGINTHTYANSYPVMNVSVTCNKESALEWICSWEVTDAKTRPKFVVTYHKIN